MEYEGRLVDLGDQIQRTVEFFFCVVSCWWQVVMQVWKRGSRIPPNKVRIRSLELEFLGQIWLCVVALLLAAVLPWGEPKAVTVKGAIGSLNKVHLVCSCCNSSLHLPPLARGGSSGFDGGFVIMVQQPAAWFFRWASAASAVVLDPPSRGGSGRRKKQGEPSYARGRRRLGRCNIKSVTSVAKDCQPNLTAEGRLCRMRVEHPLFNLQNWRPFNGVAVAEFVFYTPSGAVPGGVDDGQRRLQFIIDGAGFVLDCLFLLVSRMVSVKEEDLFLVWFYVRGLSVTCTIIVVNQCTD
jgi:hypothetical protein